MFDTTQSNRKKCTKSCPKSILTRKRSNTRPTSNTRCFLIVFCLSIPIFYTSCAYDWNTREQIVWKSIPKPDDLEPRGIPRAIKDTATGTCRHLHAAKSISGQWCSYLLVLALLASNVAITVQEVGLVK